MSRQDDWNAKVIEEFRSNKGLVGGPFKNMRLLLLHTTGARTSQERVNPLATIEHEDEQVIIASKGGAPRNPDWYHNLKANPEVEVELGTERYRARAHITQEPERSQLYAKMADQYPGFREYQRKTDRIIPVIRLKPIKATDQD